MAQIVKWNGETEMMMCRMACIIKNMYAAP